MKANNLILVPLDFSNKSMLAFKQAKYLAKISKSEIMLLNVIPSDNSTFSFIQSLFTDHDKDALFQKLEKEIQAKLDAIISEHSSEELIIKSMIVQGKVYEEVTKASVELSCNYIVLGVNNTNDHENQALGTNAYRIVRSSEVPVLTVNNKIFEDLKTVILPLDLTKETRQKVKKAMDIASFTGAKIKLVSVLLTDDKSVYYKLRNQMDKVEKDIFDNYGNVTSDFVIGDEKENTLGGLIMNYAVENDGDLIVIMTQQEQKWLKMFVGTTAMDVIYNSKIPVLSAVPNDDHELTQVFTSMIGAFDSRKK